MKIHTLKLRREWKRKNNEAWTKKNQAKKN
jgi:hypothetical protein